MRICRWWALGVAAAAVGCGKQPPPRVAPAAAAAAPFSRVTEEAGIRFRHQDGSSGRKYFAEVMGAGCAFVDLSGDGRPDVYLVNGAPLPGDPGGPYPNRFYLNRGDGRFEDATERSGLGDTGYGMGCCAGDFDGDGRLDLYVTNVGGNRLYRNRGDGRFEDVTRRAGVGAGGFCTGAAFGDYDRDGDLDLYVARYVVWDPAHNLPCTVDEGEKRVPVYCRPIVYPAARGILFRNNGNGTFSDVTQAAGLAVPPERGLGVLWTDVDEDGDPDLFVANDMGPNFLFINDGKGHFSEQGTARGVAVGEGGRPQASMGVQSFDYDGDGHLDLACTNFSGEYLALYRNLGHGSFEDVSAQTGVAAVTSPYVGFGIGSPDLDGDGRPDLFVANGHVTEAAERFYPGVTLAQPKVLLRGGGSGFAPWPAAGAEIETRRVGRGAAFADFDGDGRMDALVANWKDAPDLLRNKYPASGGMLRLALQGRKNRFAIGARVEVEVGGRQQTAEVRSGGSYLSQSELPLCFGLGGHAAADVVRVTWPDGARQTWSNLRAGSYLLRPDSKEAASTRP